MKHPSVTVFYECPCGKETKIHVDAYIEGRYSGPPESCYPSEGGEFEPEVCECGERFDEDRVSELAYEQRQADRESHYDSLREERKIRAEVFDSVFTKHQAD